MIVKKLATRPIMKISPRSSVALFCPKIAQAVEQRDPDAPYRKAPPGSAELKTRRGSPRSEGMPPDRSLGTSRRGSIDSSAASGTSSIARKNQIANGNDLKIPSMPKEQPPATGISAPSFAMFVHRLKSSFPEKIAARMKNARTASERRDRDREPHRASIPTMLIPTKMT